MNFKYLKRHFLCAIVPPMASDSLSDLIKFVRARCVLSGRLITGGPWSRRFAKLDAVKFSAIVDGGCWAFMEGMPQPVRLERGSVLVTNGTRALCLASDVARLSDAATPALAQDREGNYRIGSGNDFVMIGGMVQIDESRQRFLVGSLPPIIHVNPSDPEAASIRTLLDQIIGEMNPPYRPGSACAVDQLAQLLFIQTLRVYLVRSSPNDEGWLKALGDKQLAPVIASLHADPKRTWNVRDLAAQAGMSRTAFAGYFRKVMGMPPFAYLTHWRMQLAERDLREGKSVLEVAHAVGYTSESAFNHAFKRVIGVAPGRYRRGSNTPN